VVAVSTPPPPSLLREERRRRVFGLGLTRSDWRTSRQAGEEEEGGWIEGQDHPPTAFESPPPTSGGWLDTWAAVRDVQTWAVKE
jgi:hypothetical protein